MAIVGAIELRAADPMAISDLEVYPDVEKKLIKVDAHLTNLTGSPVSGSLQFSVADQTGIGDGDPVTLPYSAAGGETVVVAEHSNGGTS